MAEFLNLYFRQLHFDKMPIEKRATFDNYRKNNNDFNGNMKSWNSDLLDNDGKNMELLDITDNAVITEDEVKKIFKLFVDTLQSMDANKDRYKDEKKVNSFLDEYFGQNKLFTPSAASPEGDAAMAKVLNILEKNQNMSVLLSTWGVLDSEFTFENLKKAIKDQEYNSDIKIRKKVGKVIEYISYYLPTPGGINTGDQNLDAINKSMPAAEQLNQNDFANQKPGMKQLLILINWIISKAIIKPYSTICIPRINCVMHFVIMVARNLQNKLITRFQKQIIRMNKAKIF